MQPARRFRKSNIKHDRFHYIKHDRFHYRKHDRFHYIKHDRFRFADDIDGLAEEEELANLVESLDKASTAYGMEISAEKTKLKTNNTSGINTEVKVSG